MTSRAAWLTLALVSWPALSRADDKQACAEAAQEAQSLRDAAKLSAAREKLLFCAREACPKVVRGDCASWLDEVDRAMPSVVVQARDPAGRDLDGKLFVDDRLVKPGLTGEAVVLDPGKHRIAVVTSGGRRIQQSIVVALGEKHRRVLLELTAEPAREQAKPAQPLPAASAPPDRSVMPGVLGGVGAAGLVTFGVLQVLAQGEYQDAKDGCGSTRTCSDDELSPIRAKFVASGVALGVGVVALGAGVTWRVLEGPQKQERARVSLAPGRSGAELRAALRF